MLMTAAPPAGVPVLKDLLDHGAQGLKERLASQNIVERTMTIDRGSHVDFTETDAFVVSGRLVGVEIDEDWMCDLGVLGEEHDGGTVGRAARSHKVDAGMAARDFRKVGQRIG